MFILRNAKLLTGVYDHERVKYCDLRRFPRWARRKSVRGVTCRGKSDGGGAQLHAIMSAYAFCRAEELSYVHTPMTVVAHGAGSEWISSWNSFVDFSDGIEQISPDDPVANILEVFNLRSQPTAAVAANQHFHAYCDRRPAVYLKVQDEFRRRCGAVKKDIDHGVMAVHIRRGDVMSDPDNARRRTALDVVGAVITAAKRRRPDLLIKVFSEGEATEFATLQADELHLNGDVFQTLTALANAEILLTAKSSFSYVAALLSRGTVIYDPFWHKPLPTWTKVVTFLKGA